MEVVVNGQRRAFDRPPTGAELLEQLEIGPAAVVAEVNGEVIAREDFLNYRLVEGDVLELVTVVGGG